MPIVLERVYDYLKRSKNDDEYVVLTDRLWPRGIKKEVLDIDEWNKRVAPSSELRRWFGHEPQKFPEFSERYTDELKQQTMELERLRAIAAEQILTLLYAARDCEHNHPVVLKTLLERKGQ